MRTIRNILLTEYIGAILIALLVSEAVAVFVVAIGQQISWYSYFSQHPLSETQYRPSHNESILIAITKVALYLLFAYLLARWLYPPQREPVGGELDQPDGETVTP
jgi:H+/Cl- antiporter ClcA